MPSYDIAHIREQGEDIIIVPLDHNFEWKSPSDQRAAITELQSHAKGARLAGRVVPVWDAGNGQMSFIAPQNWHPYFRSLSLAFVTLNINKTLSW